MSVNRSIFGSGGEHRGFELIEHTWGDEYRLHAQFPWSALFDLTDPELGDLLPPGLQRGDTSHFFFKTSVDYVLATREGQPLLAIDFDGMGEGFNRSDQYVQNHPTHDPQRKSKFDLKLRHARKERFPYFVIGSEEFRIRDQEFRLTIANGVIGHVLAEKEFKHRFHEGSEDVLSRASTLPLNDQQGFLDNWAIGEEVIARHERSPILRATAELRHKLEEVYGLPTERRNWQHGYFPELPVDDLDDLRARFEAIEDAERISCEFTVEHDQLGMESCTVRVRNFGNGIAEQVSEELAEFLTYRKLAQGMNQAKLFS